MDQTIGFLIEAPWLIFAAYWVAKAFKTRRTQTEESLASRYSVMFVEVVGFILLFGRDDDTALLARHIFPRTDVLNAVSVLLTWAGIALAIWARWNLGEYWSARITLKEDHKLIRTGPYARLRHPIYSGLDLAAIGSALAIDRWRCAVGVGFIILGFVVKAKREEAMLGSQFGEDFQEHKRQTGFLLPHF